LEEGVPEACIFLDARTGDFDQPFSSEKAFAQCGIEIGTQDRRVGRR
jgi:hypothetical protein